MRFLLPSLLLMLPLLANSDGVSTRLKNCEIEMEMLKNSISTQEASREQLEKEMTALLKSTKEMLKETQDATEKQKKNFEKTVEKLTQDLKQLKSHENELSTSLNEMMKSIQSLKESDKQKQESLKELEKALRAITLAMGGKQASKSDKSSPYVVKSGDSLEKIARAHNMSIAEIKDLNGLSSSTIHPGQELKVSKEP